MEIIKYYVGEQFVQLIEYGECGDLSDDELSAWNELEEKVRVAVPPGHEFHHWAVTEDYDDFTPCEVMAVMSKCFVVNAVYTLKG